MTADRVPVMLNAWAAYVWHCETHDAFGTANDPDEAEAVGGAHAEFWTERTDHELCAVTVWTTQDLNVAIRRHANQLTREGDL